MPRLGRKAEREGEVGGLQYPMPPPVKRQVTCFGERSMAARLSKHTRVKRENEEVVEGGYGDGVWCFSKKAVGLLRRHSTTVTISVGG